MNVTEYMDRLQVAIDNVEYPKQMMVPDCLLVGWAEHWMRKGYPASPELQARLDALAVEVG